MPRRSASSPTSIRTALEQWCSAGTTGALRILDAPGGTIFLVDGRIAYAECPLASGVADLLTASGRLSPAVWAAALTAAGPVTRVGDVLVERGDITGAELELVTRSALSSAALFHLCAEAPIQFEVGAHHPVATTRPVGFGYLCAEVDRRRALLCDAWPDDAVDTTAVRPVTRLAGHQVALTSAQWAIIANADRVRTPIDLARTLGFDTFALLLEARRLARSGLIEAGIRSAMATATVNHTKPATEATAGSIAARIGDEPSMETRPLPRRRASRPHPAARHRHDDPGVSTATLIRVRRALEQRL